MSSDCLNCISERSSTRSFLAQALSPAQITSLKAAALAAPTAMNRQLQRFSFISDPELIRAINANCLQVMREEGEQEVLDRLAARGATDLFYGATLLVIISSPQAVFAAVDAGIAVQNLALAAQALGLGSCINGMSGRAFRRQRPDNFCERLGFAPEEEYRIAIAIGVRQEGKEPHETEPSHVRSF